MTNKDKRKYLEEIWEQINERSIEKLDIDYGNIALKLTEFLIHSVLCDDQIDIGTFIGKSKGACITFDVYNSEKILTLKLHTNFKWTIELQLRDNDDNLKEYIHLLTGNELKVIPEGLVELMKETVKSNKERVVSATALKNS